MSGMLPCASRWTRGPATSTTFGATSRLTSRSSSAHASSRMPSWPRCSVSVTTTVSTASTSRACPRSDSVPMTGTAVSFDMEPLVGRRDAVGHPHADHAEAGSGVRGEAQGHRLGAADTADDEHLGQEVALAALAQHPGAPGPALQEEQVSAEGERHGDEAAGDVPLEQQRSDRQPGEQRERGASDGLVLPVPESSVLGSRVRKTDEGDHPADEDGDADVSRQLGARHRRGRPGDREDVVAEHVGHGHGDGDHQGIGDEDPARDLALPARAGQPLSWAARAALSTTCSGAGLADVEAETLEVLRHGESPFDRCAATPLRRRRSVTHSPAEQLVMWPKVTNWLIRAHGPPVSVARSRVRGPGGRTGGWPRRRRRRRSRRPPRWCTSGSRMYGSGEVDVGRRGAATTGRIGHEVLERVGLDAVDERRELAQGERLAQAPGATSPAPTPGARGRR